MMYRAPITLCIVGAILLIVSLVLPLVFPTIFERKLTEKLIIRPDSDILKSFKFTPIPIYLEIYFFNVTNEKDVLQGAKPNLTQIGPYTYRSQKERVDVEFNHDEGTVSSKSKKTYYFEPELSVGKETDIIVTVNLVFTTLAAKVSASNISPIKGAFQLWSLRFDLNPFMTRTVGELMFDGYDEPLLKLLYPLTKNKGHKLGKTSFFFLKNGTTEDESDVITGELGMDNYQEIVKLNGKPNLDYWSTESCNQINGTEGSQFAKPISKNKRLYLYSPSLCRSIYFTYKKDTRLGPLTLRQFIMPPQVLAKNQCYCPIEFTCRSSIIDVSSCKGGTPIVISTPHFLHGESRDVDSVIGLNPQQEEHQTSIEVEPNTGVSMRVNKRLQINLPMRRYANFPSLANVSEIIFPIFYLNESALVPLERANKLHYTLTAPINIVKYGAWGLLITGLLLVFIACILTHKEYKKKIASRSKRRQQLMDKIFETKLTDSMLRETKKAVS